MKRLRNHLPSLTGIFFILVGLFTAKAGQATRRLPGDSAVCLEISGQVAFKHARNDKRCRIDLIYYNTVVDSITAINKKEFRFLLKKNAYYTIRISKKGYVTKWVSVCTDIKDPEAQQGFYRFHFDTELIEAALSTRLDADALEFPIAIICFDQEMGWFYINEAYTANIKKEIYLKSTASKGTTSH